MSEVKNKSEHQNNSATPVQAPKEASSFGETEYLDSRASTFQFIQLQAAADDKGKGNRITQLQSKSTQFTTFSRVAQLQAKRDSQMSSARPTVVQRVENKTGLPDGLKSGMESISGLSLDDVKVYRNSDKPAQLQAYAYAQGTNIHLGPGQEKHLPHELGHVVQQKQGVVKATTQLKGKVSINDDEGLEKQADLLGNKALAFVGNQNTPLQKKAIPNVNIAQLANATGTAYTGRDKVEEKLKKQSNDSIGEEASDAVSSIGDAIAPEKTQFTGGDTTTENSGFGQGGIFKGKEGESKEIYKDENGEYVDVAKGDPGDAEKAAGIIASIGSGISLFVHASNAIKQWKLPETSKWEKAGLISEVSEAGLRAGANVAKAAGNFQEAGDAKQGLEIAQGSGMGLADGLSAIKVGIETIYKVYEAFKNAKDAAEYSKDEKDAEKVDILRGLLDTAGKTVGTIKGIADMLNKGSGPLATAVPGLGAALAAVDLAIGIYDFIKTRNVAKELELMVKDAIDAKSAANDNSEQIEVYQHLLKQNQVKTKKLGVTIGLDFVSVIGNIVACIPEPNSQIAGLSLKIIAGGGKALMNFLGKGKQWLNDKAAENPQGLMAKIGGNAEESSEKIKERNKQAIHHIAASMNLGDVKLEKVNTDPNVAADVKKRVLTTQTLIKGANTDPMAVYREIKEKSVDEGMALIYQNMTKSQF